MPGVGSDSQLKKKNNCAFSDIGKNLAKTGSPMCWIVGLLLGISADLHPICRFFPGFIWKLIGWKCLIVMLTGIWSQNVSVWFKMLLTCTKI